MSQYQTKTTILHRILADCTMATVIPIFPLSLVAYPGEELNLHVFEPRYKQLVNEALAGVSTFGIPAFINGKLCKFGTEVEILSVDRVYSKGELDIRTRGVRVFSTEEVHREVEGKLYSTAKVEWVNNIANGDNFLRDEVLVLLRELHQALRISKDKLDDLDSFSAFKVAHYVGFTLEEEYDLLCMTTERERQFMLLQHLQKVLPIIQETEKTKERIQANGHFRDVMPPQF